MNRNAKIAQVEDHPELVRDLDSKALINIDNESLMAYKKRKENSQKMENRLDDLEYKLDTLIDLIKERL